MIKFNATFSECAHPFKVAFTECCQTFKACFGEFFVIEGGSSDKEYYQGIYSVTPSVISQTLQTARKYMTEDLRVEAIPYFDVSNDAGGNTIYIGDDVNGY